MAKDPAVLFYTSDFLSGTFTMTNEQVGKYMRLLCLQHQKGVLSEKDMINVCGTYDEDVFLKFEKEGKNFLNKRMKEEADRRQNFCESRRKSRQGSKNQSINEKTYVKRMETETENENEDVNINETETEKLIIPKLFSEFKKNIPTYPGSIKLDYKPLQNIAQFILLQSKKSGSIIDNAENICTAWGAICLVIKEDNFYRQKSLSTISNHIQEILQTSLNGKSNRSAKISTDDLKAAHAKRYGNGQPAGN